MTATGRLAADVVEKRRIKQEIIQGFEYSGRTHEYVGYYMNFLAFFVKFYFLVDSELLVCPKDLCQLWLWLINL